MADRSKGSELIQDLASFLVRTAPVNVLMWICAGLFLPSCSSPATLPFRTVILTDVEIVTSREIEVSGPTGETDTFYEQEPVCIFVRGRVPQEVLDIMRQQSPDAHLGMEIAWLYDGREIAKTPFRLENLGDRWHGGGGCLEGVAEPFGPGKYKVVIKHGETTVGSSSFWIR